MGLVCTYIMAPPSGNINRRLEELKFKRRRVLDEQYYLVGSFTTILPLFMDIYLVGGFKHDFFSISYMENNPSH